MHIFAKFRNNKNPDRKNQANGALINEKYIFFDLG